MKLRKYLAFMLAGAAMMFAVSCSDDDDPDPGPTPEPSPSPTYKPSLYYLGIDTAAITEKYPDMTGQMLEVRYYLNTNMNKDVQLTLDAIEYYYCYFVKQGAGVTPYSAYGKRDLKAGKDLVSHKGHEAMFGDYKLPNLVEIISLDEAIKIVKDAAAAPGAKFKCPRTGEITLHRPVDPTSAGRLFYTFGDDGSGKYSIALDAYTGTLDIRLKPTDPSPDYRASLYWLGKDTTAINAAQPEYSANFKSVVYQLNGLINASTPDNLSMTRIDYYYCKGEGGNADLLNGTRTQFNEGAPLSNISTYQGSAIDYVSIPNLYNQAAVSLDGILTTLYTQAAKEGAEFELPASDKVELHISAYPESLGTLVYDFGLDGTGQYIITIGYHTQAFNLTPVGE